MIKIYKYGDVPNSEIFSRPDVVTGVADVVTDIIAEVREKGDCALISYALKFDKAKLTSLEVTPA